jgi:hypothetical protein
MVLFKFLVLVLQNALVSDQYIKGIKCGQKDVRNIHKKRN